MYILFPVAIWDLIFTYKYKTLTNEKNTGEKSIIYGYKTVANEKNTVEKSISVTGG